MRICMVYHGGDYPPYERIDKIAGTLTAAGHEIFLLCNNYGKYPVSEERIGDVHAIRLRPRVPGRVFNRILKFPIFLNPLWLAQLAAVVRRFRIDVIQVIDLPLAPAALAVGRAFGLPVVMDMWENYPEALRAWAQFDWKTRVFKNPAVARAVELWVTRRMDHIIVVVDEQKERLVRDGIEADRISVVTNAVDADMFTGSSVDCNTPLDDEPDTYKLLYVGILTSERGLDDIICALPKLRDRIPRLRLYLAGKGNHEPHLRRLVQRENVGDIVNFVGWVPFQSIASYIAKADLCVAPFVKNAFADTTIPNKLFQYMLMAKPVLVSNAKPFARIVRECGAGFVFESRNPADATAAIEKAYLSRGDPTIGERGRYCAQAKYTWDKVAPPLVELYDRLDCKPSAQAPVVDSEAVHPT